MTHNIIACVLRTGGVYDANYVNALANAVNRNVTVPYHFICLTDATDGFNENVHELVPLRHNFTGWWSKVELFRPDLYKNSNWFFLDLDTVIIHNIDCLVTADHYFTGLDDFYSPGYLGSGLLAWKQRWHSRIYDDFLEAADNTMRSHERGDQEWIQGKVGQFDAFQRRFPGSVVSFKKHCTRASKDIVVPQPAKIICFHGTPKPHELLQYNTIRENWR